MKHKLTGLLIEYQAALRDHLRRNSPSTLKLARKVGHDSASLGLGPLDIARIHENAVIELVSNYSSADGDGIFRRAGDFFAEAIAPIEERHRTAREANANLTRLNDALSQRARDLAVSNQKLKEEILQRYAAEKALKKSENQSLLLLHQSRQMQGQMRDLSHKVISAQEEERKTISRELHDEIAQTLTGINVHLATLTTAASLNTRDLHKKITSTQRLVEKSVAIVHQFARDLRPTVLDDLGLIPALHSHVKTFARRAQLRVRLRIFADVEQLEADKKTVIYRVVQESLTNVARHARATQVEICIERLPQAVEVTIKDNGRSFSVQKTLHARSNRLGLLGMRERVEMVGGHFMIESTPTQGTRIRVQIPPGRKPVLRVKKGKNARGASRNGFKASNLLK